jgi:chloramphenicol-sensitive protein RarD
MNRGVLLAISAYVMWGFFPFYWKLLKHIPALQLLGHRIGWSFILLVVVLIVTRRWADFRSAIGSPRIQRSYLVAAILIGVNWFTYVWAVNAGFIVETSLGYFINPLVSVLLGVVILKEQIRPWQWVAIGIAAVGVLYLTISYGSLPWIALTLAFSFGFYGLAKKTAPLNAIQGLALETGILFLPSVGWLAFSDLTGDGAFLHTGWTSDLLMIGAGIVTAIPLLMFASATKMIPLSMVGILQYIAPTIQLIIGVVVFNESFTSTRVIGFSIVWLALVIFGIEGWIVRRGAKRKLIPKTG